MTWPRFMTVGWRKPDYLVIIDEGVETAMAAEMDDLGLYHETWENVPCADVDVHRLEHDA